MKIACLQENLAKALGIVSKAVPTKGALPILSNVLITAEKGKIKFAATNLETTIITYSQGSIEAEGAITVPAKLIKDFIANLPQNTISLELLGDNLHVVSEKTKSKFNGISAKDYPELPSISNKTKFIEIDPKEFANSVGIVAFASSVDEGQPLYTGVLIKVSGNGITFVSTDGFRLSERSIKVENEFEDVSAIISAKTLLEVSRIFANFPTPLKIGLSDNENMAIFTSGETLVATRLIEGEYPDYKRIIPESGELNAYFEAAHFMDAVKLTDIFAKNTGKPIKLIFDPEGKIKIASLSADTGEHESYIEARVEGNLTEVAFNSRYLLEFLTNVKSEKIHLHSNGTTSPCVLKPEGIDNFLHIVMPVQI
ncbi:DNA polymerase III subunit beta [candidate division WWE3 bacterium RIFOXYC1_FULL_40_10]|uniref:Beta sliding clamp n=1 Tax=candidate division WWE3 bacterium RIFOXYA2_FULL_46_9 TaxID=1802636 RepID=A0A1F4W0G2_UNCKA|nr:MAG: DNA polymerase III subunit beta [candidate division WWE3 bacterium RIFOXYB1_FULL_40_22]OGC61999.1 MAG: DNA polymerase III subunit beta [candidate division WWE3 bacterium RIFOXYA1_FULL_40_11]OGC62916.1 MAG: DNA polymerase III subunit beta [candidate division WWE3 bacterium RIFOXYA2_FULL_46_9]OGC65058.1 MAG: DNA polymerase III subunit beta [candidate division WWE3 bacterium RIFOXYB2_FULL_41_6]OGC66382.1 MAG: DNA polymerase III subunit beta [candidate division WWE3 bacterium RIFOXYC1_FULL_